MKRSLNRVVSLFLLFAFIIICRSVHAAVPGDFDYFVNNWNVIGLKDYVHGARISPNNELWLSGRTAVQVRFGRKLEPLARKHGKKAMEGWMPVMLVEASDGPIHYQFSYWATPLPSVKDWGKAFFWPTEGENFLCWISVTARNTSTNEWDAAVDIRPNRDIKFPGHPEEQTEPKSTGQNTRAYSWTWKLKPGETIRASARYPFFPVEEPQVFDAAVPDQWLARTTDFWRGIMQKAAHIRVPCGKANDALLAAHVCQLIANDHGEVRGGENFYDVFYIRDGAYQVMELEEAGFMDTAATAVELYLKRQRTDGRFESQANQFDANGQAVWTLWQYARITGDKQFLERAYPRMQRAVEWTRQARRMSAAGSSFPGLLPAAPADGEFLWDGKHHIPGYDFWNLRGMLCTADAARMLGKHGEARELEKEIASYRKDINSAWKRTGLNTFPPSWEKVGTHWGNTETLWPTEIFKQNDPRVDASIRFLRNEFAGGYIEGTIQWKGAGNMEVIHPYMGAYTTMADLVRGRHEQVVQDFYWYLLHSTAAHAFPEGIYYKRREAWSQTIPHVTGACNYAIMLRHMLVHEAGDELHLLSAIPDWWLEEGKQIEVLRLPTHFGMASLQITGEAKGVTVDWTSPERSKPRRVVLHLPESRPLIKPVRGIQVVKRTSQERRWDFAAIVDQYEKTRYIRKSRPSLTTGKPVTCSYALPGNPASLANDGYADDTDSYWATDVTRNPEAWWQVDLEQPAHVGRVVLVAYYGDVRSYGFTVETSLDGKTWETAVDRRNNQEVSGEQGYDCRFQSRLTRYIRINQTSNSANTGRHWVEVMAYP